MDDQEDYLKYLGLTTIVLHDHKPQEVLQSVEHGKCVFLFASIEKVVDRLLIQIAL